MIMFQIISKHKLRNKEIQKLLQKNESLLLSDKQEMEKKDIALQTIQKQLEENMFKQYPKGDLKDTTGM